MSWKLLPVLLLLPVVLPYCLRRRRKIRAGALAWAPAQFASISRTWRLGMGVEQIMLGLLLAGAVIMAAGPVVREEISTISEKGIDIALVLDISASMQAADFKPNRLEALKGVAEEFIRKAGSHRMAVYAFAGHVFTQTALTTDRRSLIEMIRSLAYTSIDHSRSGGTAIGDALLLAVDDLVAGRIEDRDQLIVLIGDGESNLGIDPELSARKIRSEGIMLEVIGIGGFEAVEVFVDGKPFINSEDEILKTKLDDTELKAIARLGGGQYQRADDEAALEAIFQRIGRMTATPLDVDARIVESSLVPFMAMIWTPLLMLWLMLNLFRLRRPLR